MEFDNENMDDDFLCDLLTADNDIASTSFLKEEARLDLQRTNKKVRGEIGLLEPVLPSNLSSTCISSIHTGDTDSSDDDDNRNQLDSNLNSYGKSIKSILPKENQVSEKFYPENQKCWNTKNGSIPLMSTFSGSPNVRSACDDSVDPVFHIRISERLISTSTLQERMKGRLAVSMAGLKRFTEAGDKETDWVLAGTIIFKSPVKTSQKGAKYAIWRLSDLKPGLKTASVFLFASACKDLWKTSIGTVVGILNPAIIDNRDGSGDEAALSVDLAQKVMILGKSKDYGLCKSTKKNGERCSVVVNVTDCNVCVYHVQTEYRKCSRRSELQSTAPRTPTLRNKVLGKNEVFYAGKSFTSVATGRNRNHVTKDKSTLQRLNGFHTKPAPRQGFSSQGLVLQYSKSNLELGFDKHNRKDGSVSTPNIAAVKTKIQESLLDFNAKKSVSTDVGVLGVLKTNTLLGSERNMPKKEEHAFLVAESAKDVEQLLKKKIPIMSCNETNDSQMAVDSSSSKVDKDRVQRHPVETKHIKIKENGSEISGGNPLVLKKQKCDLNVEETKIKRTNTSISYKSTKSEVEPSYLGLASRLGLGLNNKPAPPAPAVQALVKPSNAKHDLPKSPEHALSRGELNLKMLNRKVVIPLQKKSTCDPEVAKNLNQLKEKRNAEYEKKCLAAAEMATSKLRLKSESSSQQPAHGSTRSLLMAPKTSILTNPKVDFGVLEKTSKTSLGSKAGSQNYASPLAGPRLMPGNGFIDLNEPVPRNRRESAKLTAMKLAKSFGGFKKIDPNATAHSSDSVSAKRKREPSPDPSEEQSRAADNDVQMKFKQLLETRSRHSGLLEAHDDKEKEDYFNKLEKKEQLEEKMMTTFEVKCKAVTCLECQYTSFSAAEICKEDGHALKTRDAVKRFFKCADCGNRTVVLTRIPKTSCSKCRSSHWQRAAMMKERKSESVPLSIRGAEEKYVGAHSGGNINLLVPMS